MAHGELMMLGAYTTYVVQLAMPQHIGISILAAIPAAFLVAGAAGACRPGGRAYRGFPPGGGRGNRRPPFQRRTTGRILTAVAPTFGAQTIPFNYHRHLT